MCSHNPAGQHCALVCTVLGVSPGCRMGRDIPSGTLSPGQHPVSLNEVFVRAATVLLRRIITLTGDGGGVIS